MKDYPQGSTIRFLVKFKDSTVTATNFDELDNFIVYAYTSEDYKVKLSKTVKSGYNRLHRIDDKTLLGVIKGSQSANMLGELFIEQYAKDTLSSPEPEEIGKSQIMSTGINITLSSINEP